MGEEAAAFRGEDAFLSNFYESPLTWEGLTYLSAEAAFQSAKCQTMEERLPFTYLPPAKAKRLGRQVKLRPDWEEVKVGIMTGIIRAKFSQPRLAEKLLATGDRELAEINDWNDTFWGVSAKTGKGQNMLGRILMQVRSELRARQNEQP